MRDISDTELRHLAARLGLTTMLELDADAFREAIASAEVLRTSLREPASALEEPMHVARLPRGWHGAGRD